MLPSSKAKFGLLSRHLVEDAFIVALHEVAPGIELRILHPRSDLVEISHRVHDKLFLVGVPDQVAGSGSAPRAVSMMHRFSAKAHGRRACPMHVAALSLQLYHRKARRAFDMRNPVRTWHAVRLTRSQSRSG
jgi:hypothetical protein